MSNSVIQLWKQLVVNRFIKYNISWFIDNISKSVLILVKDMIKFLSHFESIWLDNESEKGEFIILALFIRCQRPCFEWFTGRWRYAMSHVSRVQKRIRLKKCARETFISFTNVICVNSKLRRKLHTLHLCHACTVFNLLIIIDCTESTVRPGM